jgi:hypothetical protein
MTSNKRLLLATALLALTTVGNAQSQRTEHTLKLDDPEVRLLGVALWRGDTRRETRVSAPRLAGPNSLERYDQAGRIPAIAAEILHFGVELID